MRGEAQAWGGVYPQGVQTQGWGQWALSGRGQGEGGEGFLEGAGLGMGESL